jgi:Flp pilus assembly protein TadD
MRPLSKLALAGCCLLLAMPMLAEKHDRWFEARSPHFIVICNAGDKQARKTAVQFEQIRSIFRSDLVIASEHAGPVITIFAVKDEGSLRQLLPEYWATKGHTHPGGIFFGQMNQLEVAVDLDAQGFNPYSTIYHEYYHSLTLPYIPNMPVWLAEGTAMFFGETHVEGQLAYMGEPDPGWIEELRQNTLIPLDVLFKVDHSSPYYNEQNRTSVFYAESWALTHYFMVGDNGSHRPLLMAYLQALQAGATPDQAVAKAFGDLKKLQRTLEQYIQGDTFYRLHSPAPPPISEADITTRELSEAESDAYLGGFAALRGHVQDAAPLLQQAVQLDPKLPLAYQYMGLTQLFQGQRSEAFASFSQAVALDPKNALTRYFRAYLTFGQRHVGLGDPQIEEDLRAAIAADPNFAPPYALLADYLATSNDHLPEALSLAQKGVSLEPGNSNYMLSLAQVVARMQKFDQAEAVARQARANALQPAQRAAADRFLTYLSQARERSNGSTFVASGPASSRAGSDANSEDGADDNSPEKPGGLQEATGVVTQSNCVGSGPQIELKTSTATLFLYGPADGGLNINLSFQPPAGFNPCTSLKGMRVSTLYKADANGAGGTMTILRVIGPAGDDSYSESKSASGKQTGPASPEPERPAGPATADGLIGNVTCNGNEMLIAITVGQRQLLLHSRDYTRVPIYDDHAASNSNSFLPCTQLKSHTASIVFLTVEHKRYDGEIQSVEIEN